MKNKTSLLLALTSVALLAVCSPAFGASVPSGYELNTLGKSDKDSTAPVPKNGKTEVIAPQATLTCGAKISFGLNVVQFPKGTTYAISQVYLFGTSGEIGNGGVDHHFYVKSSQKNKLQVSTAIEGLGGSFCGSSTYILYRVDYYKNSSGGKPIYSYRVTEPFSVSS